ncbi:hypothetical protein GCWU000342_01234 [Shuttleworthella satelles DSM 14600]|uniref:Uncharacterized protein n=1 Tax=Shuttleworthella satelles DSM 14600 TaxID=626523 RepID=C4GBD3_9FIRM|nr:hypothetical protein GCWU000342_01234 [Shuttleworthia satelles DSM 14600]
MPQISHSLFRHDIDSDISLALLQAQYGLRSPLWKKINPPHPYSQGMGRAHQHILS